MEHTPAASIIISTLNEEKYLPRLLDSLKNITAPLDIIVVDGRSEDATKSICESYMSLFSDNSSLRFLQSERGISSQRNMGARHAQHEVLIFSDADIVVPSAELYGEFLRRFTEGTYVAAAPRLVPIEPGPHLKFFYRTFYAIQRFLMVFNRPYFAGSYLVTSKSCFAAIGGFDPLIVLGEDVDYSLRAAKVGRCALFNIPFTVSARRVIKYGYAWLLSEIPNVFRFLFTGKVMPETIYYPFGEFGGATAHYVTKNRGKQQKGNQ